MKILIYGFGRMGLTHFSILNGLFQEIDFTVVEPNKILRNILSKNINAKFYPNDKSLNEIYDVTLITTPPFFHIQLLKNCINRGDKVIFVEKPFGGHSNTGLTNISKFTNIYIGYVLRFNPCIQWIKSNIDTNEIKSVHGQYLSNTIEKKPKGWRNGKFSGVCNEMGSHIIDLVQYIVDDEMEVISAKKESLISDVDDIVHANLITKKNIDVSYYFNWVDKSIRKPVFGIKIEMKNGDKFLIDQQQINKYENNNFKNRVSVTDLAKKVPYYLRGIDFTEQMMDLTNERKILANVDQALSVNNIISKILSS